MPDLEPHSDDDELLLADMDSVPAPGPVPNGSERGSGSGSGSGVSAGGSGSGNGSAGGDTVMSHANANVSGLAALVAAGQQGAVDSKADQDASMPQAGDRLANGRQVAVHSLLLQLRWNIALIVSCN